MLVDMRKRATSWMGWLVIGFIVLGFSFYGITSYLTGGANPTVAKLGDVELKYVEYNRILQSEQQQQRQRFGEGIDEYIASDEFKEDVARNYVTSRFFSQYVNEDLNMLGSDKEVAQYIKSDPTFQMDGQFSNERYRESLALRGTSVSDFEETVRRQIALSQIQAGLGQGDFVSDQAVNNDWAILGETRSGQYVTFEYQGYMADIKLEDADYKAYYDSHIDDYQVPAGFRIAYVRVGPDEIRQQLAITDEDIQKYYDENKAQFTQPAVKSASHILIAVNSKRDETSAKARADEVAVKLKAGEDFATLAKEYSDDPSSAKEGGSLGPIAAGAMVPEFENSVNELANVGDISEPIKTEFGYHIIKIDSIEPEEVESFADVKDDIKTQLEDAQIQTRLAELQTEMANTAYEQSDTLEPVANLAGVEVIDSEWSSGENVDPIFDNAVVRTALESAEVNSDGFNSEVIELESGALLVLRVIESREAAPLPYEEVKRKVVVAALQDAAGQQAKKDGEAFIEAVNNKGFEQAQTEFKRNFSPISGTNGAPTEDEASKKAISLLFELSETKKGLGGEDSNGNYVVAVLESTTAGTVPKEEDESYVNYQQLKDGRNIHYNVGMLQKYIDFVVEEKGGVTIDLSSIKSL